MSDPATAPRTSLMTPPATPPWLVLSKDKATPPSHKKYWNQLSLSKSKSHEAELSTRIENLEVREKEGIQGEPEEAITSSGYSSSTSEVSQPGRMRLPSSDPESGHETPGHSVPSPVASPKSVATSNLRVPKSPRTPGPGSGSHNLSHRPMTHMIAHRFTKTFKPGTCDFCQEYFFQGLKCKECKFRCHTKCEQNVPPSCGLPDQILDFFFEHITKEGSPSLPRLPPPEGVL